MIERHPYGTFIPKGARGMIIGSFPIGKFSHPSRRQEIKAHEIDYFFGGEKNLLWKLLSDVFKTEIKTKKQIRSFLTERKLAIGDVIRSCSRINGGGSDSDLTNIEWNYDLLGLLKKHKIEVLFFTSKKVESWFERLFPGENEFVKIRLHSPSAQSARALVRNPEYIKWKDKNPAGRTYQFLTQDYGKKFASFLKIS